MCMRMLPCRRQPVSNCDFLLSEVEPVQPLSWLTEPSQRNYAEQILKALQSTPCKFIVVVRRQTKKPPTNREEYGRAV